MAWWSSLDTGGWAMLAASGSMLALAAFLLYVDFNNRVHRAFALFLFLRALLDGSLIFGPSVSDLVGRLRGYLFIAVPFAVVYFSIVYRRRYQGTRMSWREAQRISLVILGAALVFEGLYFWDHGLLTSDSGLGPLGLFLVLPQVVYAGIALLFAHDFRIEASPGHRQALLIASIGLSLEPLFYSFFRVLDFFLDRIRHEPFNKDFFNLVATSGAWATLVFLGLAGWQILARSRQLGQPGLAGRVAVVWGLVMGSTILPAILFFQAGTGSQAEASDVLTMVRAVWLLGLPVLVTYALVKYHLFDADVKIRFAIKGTTLAAIFLGVAFVLSETAAEFFGKQTSNAYVGIFGASLLVFALAPLQNFAERLARAAVPAAPALAELSHPERTQIYREQLELAWADGQLTRKERLLFDRLRERLGMSAREAALLESQVVADVPTGRRHARA